MKKFISYKKNWGEKRREKFYFKKNGVSKACMLAYLKEHVWYNGGVKEVRSMCTIRPEGGCNKYSTLGNV